VIGAGEPLSPPIAYVAMTVEPASRHEPVLVPGDPAALNEAARGSLAVNVAVVADAESVAVCGAIENGSISYSIEPPL